MRFLLSLVLALFIAAGAAYVIAGRAGGPSIQIVKPEKFVGTSTPVEVNVTAPGGQLTAVKVLFEQDGKQATVYEAAGQPSGEGVKVEGDSVHITRTVGKQTVPDLKTGAGKIVVTASRKVLRGMRTLNASATRDVQVRLERPQVSIVSSKHYINLGGSAMVVYRVTPADVTCGVA